MERQSPSSSASSQSVVTSSPQSTPALQNPSIAWNEAFTKACYNHKTVLISLHQILQDFPTIKWEQLPVDIVFETDTQLQEKIVQAYHKSRRILPSGTSSSSNTQQQQQSSTLYRIASTTASVTATLVLSPIKWGLNRLLALENEDDDYYYNDNNKQHQQESDISSLYTLEQNQKRAELLSASNEKMVHMELVVALMQWLEQTVSVSNTTTMTTTTCRGVAVSLEGTGPHSLLGWIAKQSGGETSPDNQHRHSLASLFTSLPSTQIKLVLECMTQTTNGAVKIIHRQPAHCDLVLLGGGVTTSNNQNPREDKNDASILIHYFDLCRAVENTEAKIADLSRYIQELEKNAIQYKKQANNNNSASNNSMKRAMYEMQRRKLYTAQLDTLYTTLLHLEQTKNAIEVAQTNQMVLSTLSQSAATLKQMRLSSSTSTLHELDTIMLDWTEELEHLQNINDNDAFQLQDQYQWNTDTTTMTNDQDLLEELANLSIQQDTRKVSSMPLSVSLSSPATAGVKQPEENNSRTVSPPQQQVAVMDKEAT